MLWELLSQNLSAQVVAVVAALYGAYKIRRLQALAGALAGIAGTGAFAATVLVLGAGVSVAMGWLDIGAMITDAVGIGERLWSVVGDPVMETLRGVLP